MKLFSKGPSPEGPNRLRALRVIVAIIAVWFVALTSGQAHAQSPPVTSPQSITVESGVSVTVPANVTGATTLLMANSPSHGVASVSGMSLTYKSAKNYVGPDTFMYLARNGGIGEFDTLQWVTVEVTPPRPFLPGAPSITVPFGGSGTYTFNPTPDGAMSIATPPNKGTATLTGKTVTYQAADGAVGFDFFYVAATNGVGTSDAQLVRVTVQTPPPPTITGSSGSSGYPNSGQTYNYTTTYADSIEVAIAPTSGTVTVDGNSVRYIPATDFVGNDSFSVRARGPGGVSANFQTSPNVRLPPLPVLNGGALSLAFNQDATHFMGISPFTPSIVITQQPQHGTATVNGFNVTYKPNTNYIGDDSFAVTGTNLAGNSVANFTVTVAPPPIPTLTGGSLSLAFNTAGDHNFAPTNGGTLALASAPSHGVVTISGGKATYTPNPDYIGSDSYSVTGENLGGKSNPMTVNVTVSKPDAPGAGSASLATAYETAAQLELPATGNFSSIDIVDQPAKGTITLVGKTATYTPAPGFSGDDTFTYQVTGLGGSSGVASVSVKVGLPNAPTISAIAEVQTPFGQIVKIPFQVSGIVLSVKSDPLPAHGTATIGSNEVSYQPNPGFSGRDTVKLVAVGPGGDSLPAEIEVTVGAEVVVAPPVKPPVSKPGALSQEGQAGSHMRFRVTAGITETVKAVEILSQPIQGEAHVDALDVIYSPPADFVGQVAFDYRVLTEAGASEPATLTAIVHASAAEAPVKVAVATPDAPGSVELTEGVEDGPFSDAAIVSMSPATAGTAELIRGDATPARSSMRAFAAAPTAKMGDARAMAPESGSSFRLEFKPADDYFGEVVVRYSLTNRYAAPTMGTVRFMVDTRSDPTNDPKIAAMLNAQAQAAARFGEAQIANVGRRMETVRSGGGGAGISLAAARPTLTTDPFVDQSRGQMLADLRAAVAPRSVEDAVEASTNAKPVAGPVSVWTGGVIELGERRERAGSGGFDFATSGVSLGADVRLSHQVVVGAGVGLGHDRSDLGEGAKVEADAISAFGYGSWKPTELLFLDAVLGFGRMDFDTTRQAAGGALLRGSRSGDQWFAAISSGLEFSRGGLMLSPYGRLEVTTAELKAYAEEGDSASALRFAAQRSSQVGATFGLAADYGLKTAIGVFRPSARLEYRAALRNAGVARLGYAEGQSNLPYEASVYVFDDKRLSAGAGLQWLTIGGWSFLLDLEATRSAGGSSSLLRLGGSGRF